MLTKTIPSMFIRRLLLLGSLMAVAAVLPALQVAHLTVVRGEQLRKDAESKLVLERWIDTTRGRILDRKGRVLAMDRPSYDIAVDYPVITGEWANAQAVRAARRKHRRQWAELSSAERDALIQQELPIYQEQLEAMWVRFAHTAGVPLEQVQARRAEIRAQVEAAAEAIWERKLTRLKERLEREGRLPEEEDSPAMRAMVRKVRKPIQEMVAAHVVLRAVDDRTAFAFKRLVPPPKGSTAPPDPLAPEPMPGLHVRDSRTREYPFASVDVAIDRSSFPGTLKGDGAVSVRVDGVATHIIGWMRSKVFATDIKARPKYVLDAEGNPTGEIDRGHYQIGDSVGAAGLEASLERELRGLRGLEREHLDTGETEETPPQPGRDIPLTIDIMLQARIQALFDPSLGLAVCQPWHRNENKTIPVGAALSGAAVVLDVDTGEILAMVSAPSFTHQQLQEEPKAVWNDPLMSPHVNRAIARPYQPGSIVKPLMYVGAVASGKLPVGGRISCTGKFYEDVNDKYRCWIYKQHHITHDAKLGHAPDAAEAITVSCNIFFYELGRRLGARGVEEWFTKFGVGPKAELPRLGLGDATGSDGSPQMFPGSLGRIREGGRLSAQDAVLMAIGQGPVAWTPLHAADAYATLARMGLRIVPRLRSDEPVREYDLGLPPAAVQMALEGLKGSVSDPLGTGHHIAVADPNNPDRMLQEPTFNAPGVEVWGKTGTADASALVGDTDGDGKVEVIRDGDHSWTVVLCGPSSEARPKYAIAVVVDYGGSGGRVAGPIANQVIHALIAEGYLPGGTEAREDRRAGRGDDDATGWGA